MIYKASGYWLFFFNGREIVQSLSRPPVRVLSLEGMGLYFRGGSYDHNNSSFLCWVSLLVVPSSLEITKAGDNVAQGISRLEIATSFFFFNFFFFRFETVRLIRGIDTYFVIAVIDFSIIKTSRSLCHRKNTLSFILYTIHVTVQIYFLISVAWAEAVWKIIWTACSWSSVSLPRRISEDASFLFCSTLVSLLTDYFNLHSCDHISS